MAVQTIFSELRPDQARYARLAGGMMSPLWLPFVAAAGVGAAWWMMQNWPRVATGAVGGAGRSNGLGAAAARPVEAAGPQARDFVQDVAARAAESLAVQGANDSGPPAAAVERAVSPEPAASAPSGAPPAARKAESAQAKPAARARSAPAEPKPAAKASRAGNGSAAADHPEPELPPHEGLPARKKGGGKKKS